MSTPTILTYPSRQPFPKTQVVSLEGISFVDMQPTTEKVCTLETKAFSEAKKQLDSYLGAYEGNVRRIGEGTALGIKGTHGSGKTHLVRNLMQAARLSNQKPMQVYIKVESNDDLWAIYRRIIVQIDYETMWEVNTKWLSKLAQNEARQAKITEPVVDILEQNPEAVDRYLNATLLSPEVIQENLRQAVLDITHSQDFLQAISYLRDPSLGHEAYRWLQGEQLSSHTLGKLGIQDSLNHKKDVDAALRLLVTLFSYARRPLLLYIDQINGLVQETDRDVMLTHIDALKSMAEVSVREQGFLCLTGTPEAWEKFPKDFFARLRLLELPRGLSEDEALNLIKIYLIPLTTSDQFKPYSNEQEIYPYTEAAVREMVRLADGNIRALLHLAYHTFEEALPDKALITAQEVKRVFGSLQKHFSEDGRPLFDDPTLAPLEEFDAQSFLARLEAPGGAVKLRDQFYVKRQADVQLQEELVKWGSTTTIRAPRQSGKTSLLMRGLHHAKERGLKVVFLNLQNLNRERLTSLDVFLHDLARTICHELGLDNSKLEKAWRGSWGAAQKLTYFLEDEILPQFEQPLILAIDEADSLLETSFYQNFFGLVRSWHDRRALNPSKWEKLNIVLVISTEPYLLINDINQSPFNVGLKLELADFTRAQVQYLNQQHGSPVRKQELPQLMTLLGGQPYLTRQALYTLVRQGLSWSELVEDAATDQGPFGQHLQRHYWALHDKPNLKKTLKEVIDSSHCSDKISCLRLSRAGLIKDHGDSYTCRCDLYRLYFKDKLS